MEGPSKLAERILDQVGDAVICRSVKLSKVHTRGAKNMKQHITEKLSTRLIDWSCFRIMGNTVPPRDPDEDEEDEEEEEEDDADEPAVVREPDDD